ncbi:hypothetical protein X975_13207, partial [Stegodyphus mimosarum]
MKEILTTTMEIRRRKEIERIQMEEQRLRTEREHEIELGKIRATQNAGSPTPSIKTQDEKPKFPSTS